MVLQQAVVLLASDDVRDWLTAMREFLYVRATCPDEVSIAIAAGVAYQELDVIERRLLSGGGVLIGSLSVAEAR